MEMEYVEDIGMSVVFENDLYYERVNASTSAGKS